MTVVLILVFILGILLLTYSAFYLKWGIGKWLFHDKMGWHKPHETLSFDGCSFCSVCRYCKKKIMEDSQGNWFEYGCKESEDTE